MRDLGVDWPVVQDNDYAQWNAYGNKYWPAHYFIDAKGRVGIGIRRRLLRRERDGHQEAPRGGGDDGEVGPRIGARSAARGDHPGDLSRIREGQGLRLGGGPAAGQGPRLPSREDPGAGRVEPAGEMDDQGAVHRARKARGASGWASTPRTCTSSPSRQAEEAASPPSSTARAPPIRATFTAGSRSPTRAGSITSSPSALAARTYSSWK